MRRFKKNPLTGQMEMVEDDKEKELSDEEKKRKEVSESFKKSTGSGSFAKLRKLAGF